MVLQGHHYSYTKKELRRKHREFIEEQNQGKKRDRLAEIMLREIDLDED